MSVLDRQKAAGRAVSPTAGVSQYGAKVENQVQQPRPPVQDVPTNDPTSTEADAPFDKEKFEERAAAAQDRYTPVIPDAATAYKLAQALKNKGREAIGEDRFNRGIRALKLFQRENPGAVQAYRQELELNNWKAQNIESDEWDDSRKLGFEARQRNERMWSFAPGLRQQEEYKEPEEGTRAAVLRQKEKDGLDTTSGFGDFTTVFRAGMEFNSPRARAAFMEAAVRDELQARGIEVPMDMPVIKTDDELNQLVFLRPTEDGKLRWTLADSEGFRPEDLGAVSDLPSLLSLVGAVGANLAPQGRITKAFFARHPLVGEYIGDLGGRQLGTMLEYLISAGDVTPEEFQNAIIGNHMRSAVETAVGRASGRVIEKVGNVGKMKVAEGTEDAAEAKLREAAETLNDINTLSGKQYGISAAEASDDLDALQRQKGQGKNATRRQREATERIRTENVEALAAANRNTAEAAIDANIRATGGSDVAWEPRELAANINYEINRQRGEAGKIIEPVPTTNPDGTISYIYRMGGETGRAAGKPGAPGWEVVLDAEKQTMKLHMAFGGETFNQSGPLFIEQILQDNMKRINSGWTLYSDSSVSASAQRMISRMNKEGWDIRMTDPENTMIMRSDGSVVPYVGNEDVRGTLVIPDELGGAYTIHQIPGKMVKSPIPARDFDAAATEMLVEDAASLVAVTESKMVQEQKFLQAQIGWNPQRSTSNITIENASGSPIRNTINKINNRRQAALTGMSQREADSRLAQVTTNEVTEEGDVFMSGLYGDTLDYGNLTTAYNDVKKLADETGDADLVTLAEQIRRRLEGGGKWYNKDGRLVSGGLKTNIAETWKRADQAQVWHEDAVAMVNGSNLFARNTSGELVNTNMTAMRRFLGNASQFVKNMKPVLQSSPDLNDSAKRAIGDIYQEDVINNGWTRVKHNNFIKRYGDSIRTTFGEEAYEDLAAYQLKDTGGNQFLSRVNEAKAARDEVLERHGWDMKLELNPKNFLDSMNDMGVTRAGDVRAAMMVKDLAKIDPELAAALGTSTLRQVEERLNREFFSTELGVGDSGQRFVKFREWFKERENVMRTMFGDQYTTDMNVMLNAMQIEGRRAQVQGFKPDAQPIWLRGLRSLLGPLSKPQRQITAGTYAQQRLAAAKVLQIMSTPEQLAQLKVARKLPAKSRAGITAMARIGFFEPFGIYPTEEEVEQFMGPWIDEAREAIDTIMEWDLLARLDNEKMEQEK